jgi:hypothetical protein
MPGLQGNILETPAELPAALYEQLRDDNALGSRGIFHVETGEIYVFAANHTSIAEAVRTVLHEGVAHKGLRVVLGDKLPGLMEDIWQRGNQTAIGKVADRYGYDLEKTSDRHKAVEEYVAHLSETTPNAPLLRRVVDAIRGFLRQIGVLNEWTDSDIHALLRDIQREVRGKPLNQINIVTQAEIEETGEIIDISRPADVELRQHDKRRGVVEKLRECVAA